MVDLPSNMPLWDTVSSLFQLQPHPNTFLICFDHLRHHEIQQQLSLHIIAHQTTVTGEPGRMATQLWWDMVGLRSQWGAVHCLSPSCSRIPAMNFGFADSWHHWHLLTIHQRNRSTATLHHFFRGLFLCNNESLVSPLKSVGLQASPKLRQWDNKPLRYFSTERTRFSVRTTSQVAGQVPTIHPVPIV